MEEFTWRESFFFLTRLYTEELKMFSRFDRAKIKVILSELKFVTIKKGRTLDISHGAVFLRGNSHLTKIITLTTYLSGQAVEVREDQPSEKKEEHKGDEKEYNGEPKTYKTTCLILPDVGPLVIRAEKTCALFVLSDAQEFYEKITNLAEVADRKLSSNIRHGSDARTATFHVNTLSASVHGGHGGSYLHSPASQDKRNVNLKPNQVHSAGTLIMAKAVSETPSRSVFGHSERQNSEKKVKFSDDDDRDSPNQLAQAVSAIGDKKSQEGSEHVKSLKNSKEGIENVKSLKISKEDNENVKSAKDISQDASLFSFGPRS